MAPQPTKDDKLSFGLWIVGWQTPDLFGPLDRGETYEDRSNISSASSDRQYRRVKGRQTDAI
jgi:hypothetical protein